VGNAIFDQVVSTDETILSVPQPTLVTHRNDDQRAIRSLAEVSVFVITLGAASEAWKWH
jgi:hypothetical protein